MKACKILGTGVYLPEKIFDSSEAATRLGVTRDWIVEHSGVERRHFVSPHETQSFMGARALQDALSAAKLALEDIDLIISANGSRQQSIPCTAALTQFELGPQAYGIPCFDVDTTCLSFLVAMDVASAFIATGTHKRIAIISSEIGSKGLNWTHRESASLIGDGAAAVILGQATRQEQGIVASKLKTFSEGKDLACVRSGGTKLVPLLDTTDPTDFQFHMDGKGLFKLAAQKMEGFYDQLMTEAKTDIKQIKCVIPHQASKLAVNLIAKKLDIREDKLALTLPFYGCVIAASIPLTLHSAITQQRVKRGDQILMLGTSAGMSLGGMVLNY